MNIIEIKGMNKKFDDHVIFNNFDLIIEKGDMVAIMGKSGCGKTTLLNILGLIEPMSKGSYLFMGKKVPNCNSRQASWIIRNHISYLFQNFALIDTISVEANLLLALKYTKFRKNEKEKIIYKALSKVGLNGYESKKIYTLSGGEQQRVSLARAMIKPSDILFADEPTGSLDMDNKKEVIKLLKEINNSGKTILIVTHDIEVANNCNKIIELS